jgi:hypothetical protein
MPLMSAAEVPSASHETAPSCSRLGVAVPAGGATVPVNNADGPEEAAAPEGELFCCAMEQPASQAGECGQQRQDSPAPCPC